jgi:hypothetical protein
MTRQRVVRALAVGLALATVVPGWGRAWAAGPPKFAVPFLAREKATLPRDLATADFNGDHRTDVAVANLGPDAFKGGVTVILGDGTGKLGAQVDTGLGPMVGAFELADADFNSDGKMDLAVLTGTTSGQGPIRILLGTGTGSFSLGQELEGGDAHILAGELTGDANLDVLLVFESVAQIKLFAGVGDGSFSAPRTFDVAWDSFDAELVDVEGDGDLDIVGAAGGPIWVMMNLGGGNFSDQIFQSSNNLSGWQLTAADFNGDRKADVGVLNASGGDVQVGLGVGDGHFTPFKVYDDVSFQTSEIAAADFTGDGRVDLVVNHEYFDESNIVVLMKGTGTGEFTSFTYWTTGNGDPTPTDLNSDGRTDLVTYSEDPGQIYATLNAGGGTFRAPPNTVASAIGPATKGDVNGDGKLDLVMVAETIPVPGQVSAKVYTHLNQGSGRFAPAIISPIRDVETMEGPGEIVLGDVNEDGKLDLVVGAVHLFPKASNIWVMLGDGSGKFSGLKEYSTGDVHASNESIGLADMTGDGHLDIVGRTSAEVALLPGTGTGTFGAAIPSGNTGPGQVGTLIADFTGDATLDVVVVVTTGGPDFGSGDLRLNRGNGDGRFTHIQTRSFDGNPGGSQVADLNGDTRPDVAVTGERGSNGGRNGLRISLNTGTDLGPIAFYQFPPFPIADLDAADYDVDGDIDLAGTGNDSMSIALNNGVGVFDAFAEYISPANASHIAGDFTGDGRPDIIGFNPTTKPLFSLYRALVETAKTTR